MHKFIVNLFVVSLTYFIASTTCSFAQDEPAKADEKKPDAAAQEKQAVPEKKAEAEKPVAEETAQPAEAQDSVRIRKWTPFQLALFNPVQIFSKKYAVYGFNWNFLYSNNIKLYGFDLAPTGASESKDFAGFQIAGISMSKNVAGSQISIFGNNSKKVDGFQLYVFDVNNENTDVLNGVRIACIGTWSEIKEMNGFLLAPITSSVGKMNGWQFSVWNCNAEKANGVQFGTGFNSAKEMNGFQFSLVNCSDNLSGVQLGIVNYAPNNWLPFSLILNFAF